MKTRKGIVTVSDRASKGVYEDRSGPAIKIALEAYLATEWEAVCEKMLPGFSERMRAVSLPYVHTAMLSRPTAGIRGRSLVINLPGTPRAIRQCLDAVFPAVPFGIELIRGPVIECHADRVKVCRPRGGTA